LNDDTKMNKAVQTPDIPTLADVAAKAGVSTATVSRCLNTPARVGEKTRARVLEAVNTLGYAPNFGAQALAAKRTNTVGVVIPTMENAIFARALQALQEELGANGVTMLVASSSYQEDLEAHQIRTLVARGADALLLIGYHRSESIYDFLDKRAVPTLIAWSHDQDLDRPCVGFDNVRAIAELAREVLAKGHRQIGMISAPIAANDRARDRVRGVQQTMAEAGLGELQVIETPYGVDTGAAAFRQLMDQDNPPTAVMCGNDVLAVGALRGAREMGLSVPTDISITGFDDIDLATLVDPQLTTVHVPHRQLGVRAAEQLIAWLAGEAPQSIALETELRLRGTLSPPRP
jgi:LacI family transcriptional regulator